MKLVNKLHTWGRTVFVKAKTYEVSSTVFSEIKEQPKQIPFGNGRSYGDAPLQHQVITTQSSNSILSFNDADGTITCESGILLSEIIEHTIPKGWFLQVSPGTKLATLGGAIAADVHGKNHVVKGCFSNYIETMTLLLPNNEKVECSRTNNTELFKATCGGMGLTGVILKATLRLLKIESAFLEQETSVFNSIEGLLNAFKISTAQYQVAWLDMFSKPNKLKSLFFAADHCKDNNFAIPKTKVSEVPKWFPSIFINSISTRLFNTLYFKKNTISSKKISINEFFYPLDAIKYWNRVYGKKGFYQYQFVIPESVAEQVISKIFVVLKKHSIFCNLAVLKQFDEANDNYLSFPEKGFSLAMDFKVQGNLMPCFKDLDDVVSKANGKLYLAKDARMSANFFKSSYPKWHQFNKVRETYNCYDMQSFQSKRLDI